MGKSYRIAVKSKVLLVFLLSPALPACGANATTADGLREQAIQNCLLARPVATLPATPASLAAYLAEPATAQCLHQAIVTYPPEAQ